MHDINIIDKPDPKNKDVRIKKFRMLSLRDDDSIYDHCDFVVRRDKKDRDNDDESRKKKIETTTGIPNPPFLIIAPRGAPIKNIRTQAKAIDHFRCHSTRCFATRFFL